eukprot:GDKI01013886.1.p2 GENE.GDKI01013886.1~~GDKI01013886.1.p2  ORF type:complete len:164 (-),score=37.04 GDKI01013886.1:248-739(-)
MKVIGLFVAATLAIVAQAADLVDTLNSRPELSTLSKFIKQQRLEGDLRAQDGGGEFTVFAVTNQGYASQPRQNIIFLRNPRNRPTLEKVLKYHIVPGKYSMADVASAGSLTSMDGAKLSTGGSASSPTVEGATVVVGDIQADNGVLHILDRVLYPENSVPVPF